MPRPPATIRALIVEDDARYRSSIETLLAHTPDFAVVASFGDVPSALDWLDGHAEERPAIDLVLLDIELPRISGIEGARGVKARRPEVAIVMLTVFEEPATILSAICAGADGYLLKKTSARELLAQLRVIVEGGAPLTAGVARTLLKLVRALDPKGAAGAIPARLDLSMREQEVLRALVRGLSYKQVATDLGISIDTVRTHVRGLYTKLQVHSVAAAVARAIREGLV